MFQHRIYHYKHSKQTKQCLFYETLLINFEALRAMDGHGKVEGLVLPTLVKLSGIKADLTRNDDSWETWGFDQLIQELRKWLKRHNNEDRMEQSREFKGPSKTFLTSDKRIPHCFYCPNNHWPDQCNIITKAKDRKEFLKKRGLCFECGENHLMRDCKKRGCFICKGSHHSSLHEERSRNDGGSLTVLTPSEECILPLIPFEVKGEEVWGVLDTGSSKNYICRKAIERCKLSPIRWETTRLRTAEGIGRATKRPVYTLITYTQKGKRFEFEAMGLDQSNFSKIERVTSKELKLRHCHLKGLYIPESKDGKYEIEMLIGDPTFTEIRTGNCKKGLGGQPIADETLFGWTVHGERGESTLNYFTQTTSEDYEQLYRLDVLGVEDRKEFDQEEVKKEFVENIEQKEDGRYRVKIPWIEDRVPQQTNEQQSRIRLNRLMKRMTEKVRDGYEEIIEDQLKMGVIEEVPIQPTGNRIFYMPHKPVVREGARSTKTEGHSKTDFESIQKELKNGKKLFYCADEKKDETEIDKLLERKTPKGTKRIIAWCERFIFNCNAKRTGSKINCGLLITEEIENADKKLIRRAQEGINLESKEAQKLGLTRSDDKVIRCFGRLPDHKPVFIPKQSLYAIRLGEEVHEQVGHKGVNTMMARVREMF